jgi:hypothetical protein
MFETVDEWQIKTGARSRLLHLGCGSKYWEGWCNIDAYPSEETDTHRGLIGSQFNPDIWSDIRSIPAERSSIDGIASHHVLEHFYRHETIKLAGYFYDILRPGGFLVTEMPDLSRVLFLLHWLPRKPLYDGTMNANRNQILAQLYGASWEANDKSYPYHKYLWERSEFAAMLCQVGFEILLETGSTMTHRPFRDMAVIAYKPRYEHQEESISAEQACKSFAAKYGTKLFRTRRQLGSVLNIIKESFS